MNPSRLFKSARCISSCLPALLGIIALALPVTAHSMIAGKTAFVIGKVEAITADGNRRALSKGSEINTGETISTDVGARAQIRFNDGGFISLQPNSLFRVDEFNYQNKTDGQEKGFFSLLKGGLRAITGAIGRVNRDSYRVTTPVATIGIRGTGYNAELSEGLFVNVGEGAISLTNNAGLLLVSSGKAAYVATQNTLPVFTTRQPRNPPARIYPMRQVRQIIASSSSGEPVESIAPLQYSEADRRNTDGSLVIAPASYNIVFAYKECDATGCASTLGGAGNLVPTFDPSGKLIGYVSPTVIGAIRTGTITNSGSDGGFVSWGRWTGNGIGPAPTTLPSGNLGTFDYVVGIPTVDMPLTGTFSYNLISNINPTATDGTTWLLSSATLTVDFGSSSGAVNLTVGSTGPTSPSSYAVSAPIKINNTTFGSVTTPPPMVTGTGGVCTQACTASVVGFFAGSKADRAGLAYEIKDPGPSVIPLRTVQGVAAFSTAPPALAF